MILDRKIYVIFVLLTIITILGGFIVKKPSTETETKTVTQVVTKVVTKTVTKVKYVYIKSHINTNKVIDITKKDGTREHIVENKLDTSQISTNTSLNSQSTNSSSSSLNDTSSITKKYNSNWVFGGLYTQNYVNGVPIQFMPSQATLLIGYKVLSFVPIYLTGGVSGDGKSISIGALITP